MKYDIVKEHSCFRVRAFDQGQVVGELRVCKAGTRPKVFVVKSATVIDSHLRRRIGTRLYERAAREACKQGAPLQSDSERSPAANAFWKKQEKKGRATYHYVSDEDEGGQDVDFFRLLCPPPSSLARHD